LPNFRRIATSAAVAGIFAGISCIAAAQSVPAPTVEPDALAGLNRMSAALKAMPDLAFDADVTNEDVLSTGQKLQYAGTLSVDVHRPDGLKLIASSDEKLREFYYDGKSLTIYSPRLKLYATVPAPDTIGKTLAVAKGQYDIELPLADLFTWGADPALQARIVSGYVIRPETINGQSCMHYAFRQKNVDWQIWIEEAAAALPCKLVITDTSDASLPQYSAVLKWHKAAAISAATFHFTPPSDAHEITIADASKGAKKGGGQ